VLANILNFVYLWSEIRVQGGAYGCGFIGRDDGDVGFYTYRDPQPGRSLDVMNQAAAFIRGFCSDEPDLTGFILSAVSTLDPLLSTESKMTVAESRYFKGTTYEDICRYYSQLIHTTTADLLALCGALDDITADNAVCVVSGQSQMDGCGDKLTSRLTV
jgi:Zn-dependent M16 (insulinase) family peptidase